MQSASDRLYQAKERDMKGCGMKRKGLVVAKCIVAGTALTLSFSAAQAQDRQLSATYKTCMEKSGGVTVSMLDCASDEIDRQDTRLNKAYKALTVGLKPARRQELVEVQRLWVRFRKANCDYYADPDGGTASSLASSSCFLDMTAARASELEDLK
jgi:uncharacterized protein YecT (DUF1311 family)